MFLGSLNRDHEGKTYPGNWSTPCLQNTVKGPKVITVVTENKKLITLIASNTQLITLITNNTQIVTLITDNTQLITFFTDNTQLITLIASKTQVIALLVQIKHGIILSKVHKSQVKYEICACSMKMREKITLNFRLINKDYIWVIIRLFYFHKVVLFNC